MLSAEWLAVDWLGFKGKWTETYWDDGAWYGRDYFPGDTTHIKDYYAVQRKSIEYEVGLSAQVKVFGYGSMEAGARIQDIFQRDYDGLLYVVEANRQGYILEPWIEALGRFSDRYVLRLYASRRYNTFSPRWWHDRNNWDARLNMSAGF